MINAVSPDWAVCDRSSNSPADVCTVFFSRLGSDGYEAANPSSEKLYSFQGAVCAGAMLERERRMAPIRARRIRSLRIRSFHWFAKSRFPHVPMMFRCSPPPATRQLGNLTTYLMPQLHRRNLVLSRQVSPLLRILRAISLFSVLPRCAALCRMVADSRKRRLCDQIPT